MALLLQRLHQQREMDFLCDITIMVRDVEFRAHRNILAAFSDYFSSQAESGDEVTTLDPEKVSRYSLEKLLEFIYTGQMNLMQIYFCLSILTVRRAAIFLGMTEATKYLEELPRLSEPSETSQSGAEKEAPPSPTSPASPSSPSSPLPLSIVSVAGDWPDSHRAGKEQDDEAGDAGLEDEGRSDEEYSPTMMKSAGRGQEEEGGDNEEEEGEVGEEMGELSLFCAECNKQFKDVSSLRRHEKIHKGLKPFSCIFCSKTFRQATQLKTHLRIHTGEKPFSCTQCDKCFAQKCQLVAHRRMYHGEEKPYTCDRCGFKFATSSNYKIHLRLHSGEKPYVCDVCGQAFAQSSTLTYHKRRHTGEKPYQCDLCGMSFSVSSSLIAHARKHTGEARRFFLCVFVSGETPYKCSQPSCDAKFVTSSELKKHMRLTQTNKGLVSIPEGEPANPEPATPSPKATAASAASSDAATDPATTAPPTAASFRTSRRAVSLAAHHHRPGGLRGRPGADH
uniref:Myoneurin n=1 Tax=Amphiprion percula TaxID=161767 RepID=A0A3P8S168_AMPPE